MRYESQTELQRVEHVQPLRQLGPGVHNRFVVTPSDLAQRTPFVLLVEDFIGPQSSFHPHPHRGLETVTFVLEGQLEHADHLGNQGVIRAGGVQWMTAGSGIMHGGRPLGETSVHALQLWVALPSVLRASAPGTREQPLQAASLSEGQGWRKVIYGTGSLAPGQTPWSQWPLTVTDLSLDAGGVHEIAIAAGERCFIYVLSGEILCGESGAYAEGDVLWPKALAVPQYHRISAPEGARIVAYASPTFDEPIVADGPFVMGNRAEIDQAYADLRADRLLTPLS